MTKKKVDYMLKLYRLRQQLLKLGVMQPLKWMIEDGLWVASDNDYNYLSGRIRNDDFVKALESLKNRVEQNI